MPVYTYTTLDDPFAVGATTPALGINSTGQTVGNYRNFGGTHGFLYSGGTYTAIDDPLATGVTIAFGFNTSGQIVGDYNDGTTHSFPLSGGSIYTPLKGLADDFANGMVARQIVELARAGERNPDLSCKGALEKLRGALFGD
jgi:hypothetical protein